MAEYTAVEEAFITDIERRFNLGRWSPEFPRPEEIERFTRIRGGRELGARFASGDHSKPWHRNPLSTDTGGSDA